MLTPCGHRVLVKAKEVEVESTGGIILTSSETEKRLEKAGICEGVIVAIGDTAWRDFDKDYMPKWIRVIFDVYTRLILKSDSKSTDEWTQWAKVGDRVYYSQYGGKFVVDPTTEEEYVMMNDEDIMGVITDE